MTRARREKVSQDFDRSRQEEANSNGIVFECYTRDPAMKEAHRETGGYQKQQSQLESLRKEQERNHSIVPPSSLVTTQQLEEMHHEALNQDQDRRANLQSVMKSQYDQTQREKATHLARERDENAKEAARAEYANEKMSHFEKAQAKANMADYSHFLSSQLQEEKSRRQQEIADRKYDPNIEKLAQANETMAEKVARYRSETNA